MASAFFEKIGSMAKNVTDKANDALEINRINAKINGEVQKISKIKTSLGEHIWTCFEKGDSFDETTTELCSKIAECKANIQSFQEEIQAIKEAQSSPQETARLCPSCGNAVGPELKFCTVCGTQLPDPDDSSNLASSTPKTLTCRNCGSELKTGQNFCIVCGTKVE